MKLKILGAAHTVTGSKHLVTTRLGKNILLDCGLYQGKSELPSLNLNFTFNPKTIDAVILSHAHVDHSGLLPKLAKDGFKGLVYATPRNIRFVRSDAYRQCAHPRT
jgi:metallo-beta-lactamase family protein